MRRNAVSLHITATAKAISEDIDENSNDGSFLQILKILRGGAERGYASLTFNHKGDKMASVSMAPDFLLTVWDWELQRVALHAKAFGQVRIHALL